MEPTTIEFTDQELAALNEIARKHQLTITNEDLVLVMMGKRTTPLVSLTVKIATAFENRQKELEAANPPVPTAPPADNVAPLKN